MPKVVFHIGTHKTGTTSFQDHLHRHRGLLAAHDVIYPDASPHTGHHGALSDWIALPQAYSLLGGGLSWLQALADEYRHTDKTLVLSSEEFSRAGGRGGRVNYDHLTQVFEGYSRHVLCVLRDQPQFLQSVYLELSRTGLPERPPIFLDTALTTGQVDGLWCDYNGLLDTLLTHFAPGEIHLLDYTVARQSTGGLIAKMLEKTRPGLSQHIPPLNTSHWSNTSPQVLPTWAAQVVAGWVPPTSRLRDAAAEAFALEYGPRQQSLFTRDEWTRASMFFKTKNDALAERLKAQNVEFSLTMPGPAENTLFREDIDQNLWIRLARRLSLTQSDAA